MMACKMKNRATKIYNMINIQALTWFLMWIVYNLLRFGCSKGNYFSHDIIYYYRSVALYMKNSIVSGHVIYSIFMNIYIVYMSAFVFVVYLLIFLNRVRKTNKVLFIIINAITCLCVVVIIRSIILSYDVLFNFKSCSNVARIGLIDGVLAAVGVFSVLIINIIMVYDLIIFNVIKLFDGSRK